MSKEYLTYENKILGQEIERLAKEVEKLEKVNKMLLNSMVTEAHTKETKEIDRLNNIIKEVREVINKGLNINSDYVDYDFGTELLRQELLEILDKENI